MLAYKNLQVSYDGIVVLRDFSLQMNKGEIVALVGESGSGKTTVIRSALGLLPPGGAVTGGTITFHEQSLVNRSHKDWQGIRGKGISMIFQDSGSMLNPIRTIGSQFVEYIRTHEKTSKGEAWRKGVIMLEKMGLYDGELVMQSIPSNLSGGMRQRVGIAIAMTFAPELLLADEPTAALDATVQAQIVRQMMELRDQSQTGILLVTHNLGVAAYMADRILVMKEGTVVEVGNREDILLKAKEEYTRRLLEAVPSLGEGRYV